MSVSTPSDAPTSRPPASLSRAAFLTFSARLRPNRAVSYTITPEVAPRSTRSSSRSSLRSFAALPPETSSSTANSTMRTLCALAQSMIALRWMSGDRYASDSLSRAPTRETRM